MNKQATILDIANRAGVSHMTVSRVFTGNGHVRESTRRRILSIAEQLDYLPNVMAKGVRGLQTQSAGIVWEFVDPWAGDTAVGLWVMQALQRQGLATYQSQSSPDTVEMRKILDDLLRRRVDAIVIGATPEILADAEIRKRLERVPAVVVISYTDIPDCPGDLIVHDRNSAIREVVNHFAGIGRKRPGLLLSLEVQSNQDKYMAFLAACAARGIQPHPHSIIEMPAPLPTLGKPFLSDAARYTHTLEKYWPVGTPVDVDAIFSFNDLGAMSACNFLQDRGLRVPEDVAVVGFNDDPAATLWRPALASGDRCRTELADATQEMVMSRLAQLDLPRRTQKVAMKFIWRPSAGGNALMAQPVTKIR